MANILKLSILTPEKELYSANIKELIAESVNGSIAILHNHIPLVTLLKPAVTRFKTEEGKELKAFTSNGVLKVKDNTIVLLCDACEWPEDIDLNRAKEAQARAEKRLNQKDGVDVDRANAALVRAVMRIKTK